MSDLDSHWPYLKMAIQGGNLIPFFGAGVNLCDRPPETVYNPEEFLPSGSELAKHLSDEFKVPQDEIKSDLLPENWTS